MIVMAMIVHLA